MSKKRQFFIEDDDPEEDTYGKRRKNRKNAKIPVEKSLEKDFKDNVSHEMDGVSDETSEPYGESVVAVLSRQGELFEQIRPRVEILIAEESIKLNQYIDGLTKAFDDLTDTFEKSKGIEGKQLFKTMKEYIEPLIRAKFNEYSSLEKGFKQPIGVDLHELFEKLIPLIKSEVRPKSDEWKIYLGVDQFLRDVELHGGNSPAALWLKRYVCGTIVGSDGATKGRKRVQEAIRYAFEFLRSNY